jgi:hypothetical protein
MQDLTICNIHVQDVTGFDANSQPTVTKRVTFYVGKNGPFILNYTHQNYSAEQVQADMDKEAATLRTLTSGAA